MSSDFYIPASHLVQALTTGIIPTNQLLTIMPLLTQNGHSAASLQAGLDVPAEHIEHLLETLHLSPAISALHLGQHLDLANQAALGPLLPTASTLRSALQLIQHYMPLLTTTVQLRLEENEHSALLYITPQIPMPRCSQLIVFCTITLIRQLCLELTAQALPGVMHTAWPQPPELHQHPLFDPALWHFDAPCHCLVMPVSALDSPCHQADPARHAHALQHCAEALHQAQPTAPDIIKRVRELLIRSAKGHPGQDSVAAELFMSVSTLKRHLAAQGACYSELLEESRRQRALLLLNQTGLPLQHIAEQLGYANQGNFSHAFRKWTGRSPQAFRRSLPSPARAEIQKNASIQGTE